MRHSILGLDIGGANLKFGSAPANWALSRSFALWKNPSGLAEAIGEFEDLMGDGIAVTMTGELCDCWENKRGGVAAILDAVEQVADNRPVHVWTNEGTFVDPRLARDTFEMVASANWLATATYMGKFAPSGNAILIDIGTTTTDIVPLVNGRPVPLGRTDTARLAAGELVYRGWKRTPVCALGSLDLAAEFFATMHDVFLILGDVGETPSDHDTADGRAATSQVAGSRLARMFCLDPATCPEDEIRQRANDLADRLARQIASEIARVAMRLDGDILLLAAGSGEFVLPRILEAMPSPISKRFPEVISLANHWEAAGSSAAAALSVAWLCLERGG